LYYRAPDGRLILVPVRRTSKGLQFDAPTAVGISVSAVGHRFYSFEISVDGKRILTLTPERSEKCAHDRADQLAGGIEEMIGRTYRALSPHCQPRLEVAHFLEHLCSKRI